MFEMEAENYQIVNWEIENLSCWNQALHGVCIESDEIGFEQGNFKMKLYPKGTSGQEEHMVVNLLITERKDAFSGVLSFNGADGSTLCTQHVQPKDEERDLLLPPGPRFEEVKTRENKSDLKDQLILRLQIKSAYSYDEYYACTIIEVFDVTLEVDRCVIVKDDVKISAISYSRVYDSDLYLGTGKTREDEKLELHLYPIATEEFFSVKSHLSLISSDGSLIRYEQNEHMFHESKPWVFSDSLSRRELSENVRLILNFKIIFSLVSHTLRSVYLYFDEVKIISNRYISVCMENSNNVVKTHSVIAPSDSDNAVDVLTKELMCLYQDQDFSDLQLNCQSVSFPVHKAILSARSTVFKTMLSSNMTEALTGCVDILDLEVPTLARFLAFLYTGTVEDLQGESALKLYYAADKYNVPSLKRECASFLSANVCVSNVCDVLSLGDKHQDSELVAAAHNFVLRNFNEVLKSKEWKSFMCSEPLLAVKTVTDFAEKDLVGNFKHFAIV